VIRKRRLLVPAVSALAVGGVLWAAQGPMPLAKAPSSHSTKAIDAKLAAANTPANGGQAMSVGDGTNVSNQGCSATAGQKGLLSKPMPASQLSPSNNYSITFNDGSGLSCFVWTVDGQVQPAPTPSTTNSKTYTLTFSGGVGATSVSVFVVDGENGGKWDEFTWQNGLTGPAANNTVTFPGGCSASAGAKQLLFNPSSYGAQLSIDFIDGAGFKCDVWTVDGNVAQNDTSFGTKSQHLTFSLPANNPPSWYDPTLTTHTITLSLVNNDKGGKWDQYTWTTPPCGYPPNGGSHLGNVQVNSKGEVTGTLFYKGCPAGGGHKITEQVTGSTATAGTDPNGNFKFGAKPSGTFPATISFAGDNGGPNPLPAADNKFRCDATNSPTPVPCAESGA